MSIMSIMSKIIAVNTINISLGQPTHNITTIPPNPKIIVSPWNLELNSQQNNLKNIFKH